MALFGIELLAFGATIAVLLFSLYYRKVKYWSWRGIPGPTPLPLLGTVYSRFSKPLFECDADNIRKYGKVFGEHDAFEPTLVVADPDMIKQIMVKDFKKIGHRTQIEYWNKLLLNSLIQLQGPAWKWIRDQLTPTFSASKMKRMFPIMKECTDATLEYLDTAADNKADVHLKKAFGCYTMDIISQCCYSTKIQSIREEDSEIIRNSNKVMNFNPVNYLLFQMCPAWLLKLFRITLFDAAGLQYFADLTQHIIDQRDGGKNGGHNDFLQFMLEAQQVPKGDKTLTVDDIISSSIVFFPAGYDTTANTLSYAVYEMAMNADIQDKLYAEVSEAFATDSDLEYDRMSSLKYLDAFVCEVLRKYPPILRTSRMASEDYELAPGIVIPKNVQVFIPLYCLHHTAEYFPDPERFDPERFVGENRHKIRPFTYLPFGEGPRQCIGMRFALLHAKLGMARILLRFRVVKTPATPETLTYDNGDFVLRAKIAVGFEKRSQ